MEKWKLYCDGSTKTNPGIGAWAAILIDEQVPEPAHELITTKAYERTTNNRMEMLGVIEPLERLHELSVWGISGKVLVHVFSDSKYVVKGITDYMPSWKKRQWRTSKGSPVKNQDLWVRLNEMMGSMEIVFTWVKGHSDNALNNRCDVLARDALNNNIKYPDNGYTTT